MKKHAKLLVLVLSLALIIGAIAIVASADNGNVAVIGETEYASLEQAITAAQDNDVVKLIANAEIAASIEISKSISIDLNGKVLTAPAIIEIGAGNINFKDIIPLAEECGVKYFVVEDDRCIPGESYATNKRSADYIIANFLNK